MSLSEVADDLIVVARVARTRGCAEKWLPIFIRIFPDVSKTSIR